MQISWEDIQMAEDLRILFIEAYRAWIEAKTFSDREFTWGEYTQIRDLWIGKGTAYNFWANRTKEPEPREENN